MNRWSACIATGVAVCICASAALSDTSSLELLQGFVPNQGQWPTAARFIARHGDTTLRLEPRAIALHQYGVSADHQPSGCVVRLVFDGANQDALAEGVVPLSQHHNFFVGNDPENWASDVVGFEQVRVRELYPGVDLVLRLSEDRFTYDLLVDDPRSLSCVAMHIEGADGVVGADDGTLRIDTGIGPLIQHAPRAFRVGTDGARTAIACGVAVDPPDTIRFVLDAGESDAPFVIDPGLEWSTFLGGLTPAPSGIGPPNQVRNTRALADGSVLLVGQTGAIDFPVTPGAYRTALIGNWSDGFITKLNASGNALAFSTFLGGSTSDFLDGVTLSPSGTIIVGGTTASSDFPITPGAYSAGVHGLYSGVSVACVSPIGNALQYSTAIWGAFGASSASDVEITPMGEVVVAGTSNSSDFPTTPGAFDTTFNSGGNDGFIFKLNAAGSALAYSTFLGASSQDVINSSALGPDGSVYVTGFTFSTNFPTTPGSLQPNSPSNPFRGPHDAFVTRLDPSGGSLIYSTYLAGFDSDDGRAIEVDPLGRATIVGSTNSHDFPTTPGSFLPTCFSGCAEGFITRLTSDGSAVVWSTFFGDAGVDEIRNLALDASGGVTVLGITLSPGTIATPGAFDTTFAGNGYDLFVEKFDPGGKRLYGTYLGGSMSDDASPSRECLSIDATGAATVAGELYSPDFPVTPGTFDTTFAIGKVFITRLDLLPTGVTKFGRSTAGCRGPVSVGVSALPSFATSGNKFEITCTAGPTSGFGILAVSLGKLVTPIPVMGAQLYVDPLALVAVPVTSGVEGYFSRPASLNGIPIGTKGYVQFLWQDPCAPLGVSASNALEIVVQP